jgi:uncharacterized sulfatase
VRSGAYPNHTFAKAGTKSVVHYLQPLGYRVALSGKRHISPPNVFPFEYSTADNNPDFDAMSELMSECKESGTPFCLFACSNEPHSPWNKGDPSQYDADKIKLPPYFVDTAETRNAMVNYLAEISYYDWQVGRCLELLRQHGLEDNTLVMVVSEQGSSFPFGKWTCYDTGLQSAMIVRWPGRVQPGAVTNAMVEYVDILPTFLDAAGSDIPTVLEGRSFVPVLRGQQDHHKDYAFALMTTRGIINGSEQYGIRSVRSAKFKYIRNLTPEETFSNACVTSNIFVSWQQQAAAGDAAAAERVRRYQHRPGEELYAIGDDWYEWNNLADDPAYAKVKKELRQQLDAWMKSQGDLGKATELAALEHQTRGQRKAKDQNHGKKDRKKKRKK